MASHRELVVWQNAHENLMEIIHMCDQFPHRGAAWEIERQLVRSAGSIGANIAEGQGRQRFGRRQIDSRSFFEIAYGSATETDHWLRVVLESGWVKQEIVAVIIKRNDDIMRMLYAFVERQQTRRV